MPKLFIFLIYYVAVYMGNAVYGTFIPVYFHSVGFSQPQIGTLLSLGPLIAILAQPVWGAIGDRARTKNTVLLILIAGSALSALLYPLSDRFVYLLVLICIFTFFQTSVFPISDAITLEELDKQNKWSFGPIRLGGTVGFAIMSVIFGVIAKQHIGSLFPVYAVIMAVSFLLVLRFPAVQGHQSAGSSMRIGVLFRNRKLMLYLGMTFVLQITLGYYYSFFPIYFRELGGDSGLLGWSMVVSSLSEVPFLLFSGKIFKRIGIPYILLGSALATAVRWYLFYVIKDPYWALPVQLLHGLIFIVLSVTMATFINREVPSELKASGQTLNGLISLGAARIIGSFAGGIASAAFGMRRVFLYNSLVAALCMLVFGFIFWRMERRARLPVISA